MSTPRLAVVAVYLIICVVSILPARGQMQPHARYEGEMLPITRVGRDYFHVLQEGKRRRTWKGDFEIRPSSEFGAGVIEISNIEVDYDPLRDEGIKERSRPNSINFTYEADISSDRDLKNCYALLTLLTNGSIGTHFFKIGDLRKGRSKHLEMDLTSRVDSVGSLHVFSESIEVRSNQITEAYDLTSYHARLIEDTQGLAAVELYKSERFYPHVLSDDGRLLATTRDRDTHYSLIAYDLESMKLLCDVQIGEYDDRIGYISWVSNDKIAFICDQKLMLLDVTAGTYETLRKNVYAIIGSQANKSGTAMLLTYKPSVGVLNVKYDFNLRRSIDFEEFGSGAVIFDDKGDSRLRYEYVHDGKRYYFKANDDSRWRELDKHVKEDGLYFDYEGRNILDRVADIHSIGPDGDLLYISTRLDSDKFKLAAYSMSKGVIEKTIAEHPDYDLTTGDSGLSRLLFRKGSSELIGMIYEAKKPEVVWLDEGFSNVQTAMENTFPDHINIPVDWSEGGSTFIFFTFSDQDPGTYYVFRPLESKLFPVLRMGERFKDDTMAQTIPIEIETRDGATIHGYVTYPPNQGEKQVPLIVEIHGGPTVRDNWGFNASNQFLASHGYAVLQVNYRGSSGFGAEYQNAGLRARLDTIVLDDVADGVHHLVNEGKVDPKRIGVMGGSFGGWATYMSLIKYPELYQAGVAIAAVSHWKTSLSDSRWKFDNKLSYSFWKALLDHGDFKEDEKFIDPLLRAQEITQPIYIIHGERDTVVHAREARLMLNALRKQNDNVEAMSFPRSSHTYWPFEDRVRKMNEIGDFFDTYLAQPTPDVQSDS